MAQRYFAAVSPGLEEPLLRELRTMRVKKLTIDEGGVEFQATSRGFYQVLHNSRIASRIYLRVDDFRARDRQELYRKSRRIDWERLLNPFQPLFIDATSRRSSLTGTGEITDVITDGITDHFEKDLKQRNVPKVTYKDPHSIRLVARLSTNRCTLSLDAAGQPMHRRGWRAAAGKAPLRENIACALLETLGWKPGLPLLDPMCGAGTFLIEAARYAQKIPPRDWKEYPNQKWENFQSEQWEKVTSSEELLETAKLDTLFGQDKNAGVLRKAVSNARGAQVEFDIQFERETLENILPPCEQKGFIIANPPYGHRLEREESGKSPERLLTERFADHFEGWTLGLLLPEESWPVHPKLKIEKALSFQNGGLPVHFWILTHPK